MDQRMKCTACEAEVTDPNWRPELRLCTSCAVEYLEARLEVAHREIKQARETAGQRDEADRKLKALMTISLQIMRDSLKRWEYAIELGSEGTTASGAPPQSEGSSTTLTGTGTG